MSYKTEVVPTIGFKAIRRRLRYTRGQYNIVHRPNSQSVYLSGHMKNLLLSTGRKFCIMRFGLKAKSRSKYNIR